MRKKKAAKGPLALTPRGAYVLKDALELLLTDSALWREVAEEKHRLELVADYDQRAQEARRIMQDLDAILAA